MKTNLSAEERETIINFTDFDDIAIIYTCQKTIMTKLQKLSKQFPDTYKLIREDEYSQTYEFPSSLVTLRSPREQREYTEEQRAELQERGRRLAQYRTNSKE